VFGTTFTLGGAWAKLAQIPETAARIFREGIGTEISPDLQEQVRAVIGEPPGPPSSPFEFATEKSARFYFWLITSSVFSAASDGSHWIRSGELENSWQVEVSYGALSARISVISMNWAAKYVYGPKYQVQGHANTGWGSQYQEAQKLILANTKRVTIDFWTRCVRQAVKEVGL
jgi:hypothetical protein